MTPVRKVDPMETPPQDDARPSGTMSRVELKIDALHSAVSEIREYVMGPFGESHKGLDARVRQLEEAHEKRAATQDKQSTVMWGAIASAVIAAGAAVWNLLTTGKAHP